MQVFDLRDFVLKAANDMIGVEPEYRVRQFALGWFDRGTLKQDDLAAIDARYAELAAAAAEEETEASET